MPSCSPNYPTVIKGRGSAKSPANRFVKLEFEPDSEWLEFAAPQKIPTEYFIDNTKEILAKNYSPDVPFTYSINPYRGCEHGCVYCYARPSHEYFELSAGLDFETKIFIKKNAPELLEKKFRTKSWQPQVIAFSGNTDCYQPIERKLGITRECLKIFLKYKNPVGMLTKNSLISRDLDILTELSEYNLVHVGFSITTLNNRLARKMEPRTAAPKKRLEVLEKLCYAGIPVSVFVAPVIPGLTDHEMPAILKAAAQRGVKSARYILLRLPFAVKDLVQSWLHDHYPDRANKVINFVKDTRAGQLNDPCFETRLSGVGLRAEAIKGMFDLTCKKFGLNEQFFPLSTEHFVGKQIELF